MKRFYSVFVLLLIARISFAQDIHFSQFYSSPITLNPANAGINSCDYRAGINYRSQWKSVTVPYKTFGAWGDIGVLKDKILEGDVVGLGLSLVSDKAGDGEFSTTKLNFAAAYHKSLSKDKRYVLSIALGLSYVQKKLDFTKLYWDDQWNGEFFDPTEPTNESPTVSDLNFLEFQTGLRFQYNYSEQMRFWMGAAMYHVNSPAESFLGSNNRIGKRPVIHAGANIILNEQMFLEPSLLYMNQKKAYEMSLGSLMGYTNENWKGMTLLGGLWYRVGDAAVLVVGGQYQSFRLLMNYDFNISQLTPASNARGGFELSLIYVGCIPKYIPPLVIPCPRL